jgi:MipA family protein
VRNSFFYAGAFLVTATPLYAQDAPAQDAVIDRNKDTLMIGIGGAIAPSYDGSDNYRFLPIAAIRGKVSGIGFTTLGTQLFVDVIPDNSENGLDFQFGPVAGIRLDRTRQIKDAQVRALGELDTPVELGGYVGIAKTGVITSAYDTVSASVAYVHDVAGAHDSYIITPTITYGTPLNQAMYIGVTASADYVGHKYAQSYFGVTPAGSLASGLAPYSPGKGLKDVSFGLLGNYALSGDLRRGMSVFAIGNYARLMGDFKRSPVVADAGNANQWFGGIGLAYTF